MAMLGNSILFYDDQNINKRDALRVLSSTGAECVVVSSLEELANVVQFRKFSIFILDISGHRHLTSKGFKFGLAPTVIMSTEKLGNLHPYLANIDDFTYFIAKNSAGELPMRDLLVTVRKILNMDIFGVEKYLNWGASHMVFHVRDSATRSEYIKTVVAFCRDMHIRSRDVQAVNRLCEEMLMNAIYDAPRDYEGNELHQSKSRTEHVVLEPSHSARLEIASDGERLGVSVSDPFGAITRPTILNYLSSCFAGDSAIRDSKKHGGAGLGLFMCFNSVSSLIVNVHPGLRTEFIGILDIGSKNRGAAGWHPSFHYFSTDHHAPQFLVSKRKTQRLIGA